MNPKVLIVDDSLTIRMILRKLLSIVETEPAWVHEAINGDDALSQMRIEAPHLVMADLNMEGMSGVELIQAMRRDPALKSIPVVVISSEVHEGVLESLKGCGVLAYVRKPIDLGQMKEQLDVLLANLDKLAPLRT